MSIKETDLHVDTENELWEEWPKDLMGCLQESYVAGLTSGEEVLFNYSVPQGNFIGLAQVDEGPARVDIWINPERVVWIEPVEEEPKRVEDGLKVV